MARLERRRRLYYAVRDIPKPAQKKLGKRRFLKSTGASDRTKAAIVAASFDVLWLEQIDRAMNGPAQRTTREEEDARIYRQATFWRDRINRTLPSTRQIVIEQMKEAAQQELDPDDPSDPEGIRRAELFVDLALGQDVPLEEKIEDYLAVKAKDAKAKMIDLYRKSLIRFCERFPRSSDASKQAVKLWVSEMRDAGLADNTLQRTFAAIRGYWKYLQDTGVLSDGNDPFAGVLKTNEKGKNRRGKAQSFKPFEPSDVVRLWRAAEAKEDRLLPHQPAPSAALEGLPVAP